MQKAQGMDVQNYSFSVIISHWKTVNTVWGILHTASLSCVSVGFPFSPYYIKFIVSFGAVSGTFVSPHYTLLMTHIGKSLYGPMLAFSHRHGMTFKQGKKSDVIDLKNLILAFHVDMNCEAVAT